MVLTKSERSLLVDQALLLIEHLYVHLPQKRAMHAVDPLQRLRLLRHRSPTLSESAFHAELVSIFNRLRDLHTNYILPAPFRSQTAYLPFRIENYFEGSERCYVVTEVQPGEEDASFRSGVLITHWNGIPIQRAVDINADREAGGNLEARHARGLAAMTTRWLAMSLPPDEEWVTVTYKAGKRLQERRFDWNVFETGSVSGANDPLAPAVQLALVLGLDAKAEMDRRAHKLLFRPEAVEIDRRVREEKSSTSGDRSPDRRSIDFGVHSKLPDVFTFRVVRTRSGRFGYLRIHTFLVDDDAVFVEEFIRLVDLLPQNGLILDVRGNGGGNIVAGERLLQVLTPQAIEPERFCFINSPLTLRICKAEDTFAAWRPSIEQAIETGATFSDSHSLVTVESCNDIGQKYQGPVVLITDARCYSTTDIFAAGFQDHGIGKVLGTSGTTGAGGANVWSHDLLLQLLPPKGAALRPLPKNASFRVAARRCTRVGKRAGALLEDLGVVPDEVHRLTRKDVLHGDVDLINRAGEMLAAMPVHGVTANVQGSDASKRVEVTTKNVTRLDVLLNSRPYQSLDLKGRGVTIELPLLPPGAHTLELRGFVKDRHVVSTRVRV